MYLNIICNFLVIISVFDLNVTSWAFFIFCIIVLYPADWNEVAPPYTELIFNIIILLHPVGDLS
jgi:hypothetical protein